MPGLINDSVIPVLPPDFNRADAAEFVNATVAVAWVALVLVVLLLAVIVFRGRS